MLKIHNFIDGKTNPVVKVVVGLKDVSTFPTTFPFIATDWRWCWTPKRLKFQYYLYHQICLTINKIVYYQHLLVTFEELLSLRLSDPFALVVGGINNNWINLWKKMRGRCSKAFRLLYKLETGNFLVWMPWRVTKLPAGPKCIMLWYPKFIGGHFGLPPSSIHRMTGLGGNLVWTIMHAYRPLIRPANIFRTLSISTL